MRMTRRHTGCGPSSRKESGSGCGCQERAEPHYAPSVHKERRKKCIANVSDLAAIGCRCAAAICDYPDWMTSVFTVSIVTHWVPTIERGYTGVEIKCGTARIVLMHIKDKRARQRQP